MLEVSETTGEDCGRPLPSQRDAGLRWKHSESVGWVYKTLVGSEDGRMMREAWRVDQNQGHDHQSLVTPEVTGKLSASDKFDGWNTNTVMIVSRTSGCGGFPQNDFHRLGRSKRKVNQNERSTVMECRRQGRRT